MGKQWLRLYRQFVQEPRVLRTVGRDKDVEVSDWTVSHLKSDDVIIENSSALAETPAQRRQMVFDMLGAGLFNKAEVSPISDSAREKILEMLEYGNWEGSMMEIQRLQEQKAKRENMRFKQAQPAMLNDYDDDALHIEMHNRLRMSAEYEDLLNSPQGLEVDQMINEHIAMHEQRIMMRQMQQLQQQIAIQQSQTNNNDISNGGKEK